MVTLALCATAAGTAAAQAPTPGHVYWNGGAPAGRTAERPSTMLAALGRDGTAQVLDLRWSTWGAETAQATGSLRTPATTFGREPAVNVTLHDRVDCFGTPVYTAWSLTLPDGTTPPRDFAQARERIVPCSLSTCPGSRASCRVTTGFRDRTMPNQVLRSKAWFLLMEIRNATQATETVTGFLERNRRFGDPRSVVHHWIYPIRIRLSGPRWCAGAVIRTRMTITAYGPGAEHDSHVYLAHPHLPSRALRHRLLRDVGRQSAARHRQTTTRCGS
jgi:hypothetical protein